jgi:DTW domain-containing protein YfiP
VAALCLELAGDRRAGEALAAYLDVFTEHYLAAKRGRSAGLDDELHRRLRTFL